LRLNRVWDFVEGFYRILWEILRDMLVNMGEKKDQNGKKLGSISL